jgi:hypothetical protein
MLLKSKKGKTPTLAGYFKVQHTTICNIRDMKRWQRVAPATEAIPLSELSKTIGQDMRLRRQGGHPGD